MARAHYIGYAQDEQGNVIAGATVEVREVGTSTQIPETIYSVDVGGSTLANPFTAGSDGKIEIFLDVSKRVDFFITKSGFTARTQSGDVFALNAASVTLQDEGANLTQRALFNFVGDSVVAVDNPGATRTDVTINHLNTAVHSVDQPPAVHNLIDTTKHPVSGLTTGHAIRATGATAYAFQQLQFADVGGAITDAQHGTFASGDLHTEYTRKALLTAKGSVYGASAASTPVERTVGSNNQALIADSGQSSGLNWGTPWTSATPAVHGIAQHTDVERFVWTHINEWSNDGATAANNGTNPGAVRVFSVGAAVDGGGYFSFVNPSDAIAAGALEFQVAFSCGTGSLNGEVARFTLRYLKRLVTEDVTAAGVTVTTDYTRDGSAHDDTLRYSGRMAMGTADPGDFFRINVKRMGADVADTFNASVLIIGAKIFYTAVQ